MADCSGWQRHICNIQKVQDVNSWSSSAEACVIQDRGEAVTFLIRRCCKRWQRGRRYQYFSCFVCFLGVQLFYHETLYLGMIIINISGFILCILSIVSIEINWQVYSE